MQEEKRRPLPKFGDWDVNDPASADGFTVIFSKAKDDKRASGNGNNTALKQNKSYKHPSKVGSLLLFVSNKRIFNLIQFLRGYDFWEIDNIFLVFCTILFKKIIVFNLIHFFRGNDFREIESIFFSVLHNTNFCYFQCYLFILWCIWMNNLVKEKEMIIEKLESNTLWPSSIFALSFSFSFTKSLIQAQFWTK